MDKQEHAALLRAAIVASGVSRAEVAKAVGRSYRTIGNWTSERDPTLPTAAERRVLRDLLGPYDDAGDRVESAIRGSTLTEDRQYDVIGYYKRQLREQAESELALAARTGSVGGLKAVRDEQDAAETGSQDTGNDEPA